MPAAAYRGELAKYGLTGSMSRRGNPYDNAKAESFMKTLKVEEVYLSDYQAEIMQFPFGRHDDQVDSLSQALWWQRERSRRTITVTDLEGF